MNAAYVDTSCLVAIAFGEPGADKVSQRLNAYDHLLSADLCEAELRAAVHREGRPQQIADRLLGALSRVRPDRALSDELQRVLACDYLRGADLLHVATALFVEPGTSELVFETLDLRQREVARRVGFDIGGG